MGTGWGNEADALRPENLLRRADMRVGRELPDLAEQARTTIEHAAESMRFNPRRLLMRQSSDFSGYRITVCALQRANEQVMSMCRSLRHSQAETRVTPEGASSVAGELASVLRAAAEATRVLGVMHHVADLDHISDLDGPLDRGRDAVERASGRVESHALNVAFMIDRCPVVGAWSAVAPNAAAPQLAVKRIDDLAAHSSKPQRSDHRPHV